MPVSGSLVEVAARRSLRAGTTPPPLGPTSGRAVSTATMTAMPVASLLVHLAKIFGFLSPLSASQSSPISGSRCHGGAARRRNAPRAIWKPHG